MVTLAATIMLMLRVALARVPLPAHQLQPLQVRECGFCIAILLFFTSLELLSSGSFVSRRTCASVWTSTSFLFHVILILLYCTDTVPACTDNINQNHNNSDDEEGEEGGGGVNQAADFDRMMRSELIKVRVLFVVYVLFVFV